MNFVYFVGLSRADIDGKLGDLSYAFDGAPCIREAMNGPGGLNGCVLGNDDCIGYYEGKQNWIPHHLTGDVSIWVGCDHNSPPKPEELTRDTMLPGSDIKLQDGNPWHVPLIRMHTEIDGEGTYRNQLPRSMGVDPGAASSGQFQLRWDAISPKYARLLDVAEQYYGWYCAEASRADDADAYPIGSVNNMTKAAVDVLAANYRVGLAECVLLDLFDSATIFAQKILNYAVLDMENLARWLAKKKDERGLDGSSLHAGRAGDHSPDMSQPTLTT